MKITINQLRKIIKEEVSRVLSEGAADFISSNLKSIGRQPNFVYAIVKKLVEGDSIDTAAPNWDAAVTCAKEVVPQKLQDMKNQGLLITNRAQEDAAYSAADEEGLDRTLVFSIWLRYVYDKKSGYRLPSAADLQAAAKEAQLKYEKSTQIKSAPVSDEKAKMDFADIVYPRDARGRIIGRAD